MTVDQVIQDLMKEKQLGVPSRFPCRAIMVKNIEDYSELLSKLNRIPDVSFVLSADLFPSADVMPRFEKLRDEKYRDQWLILPGVSEYLRLFNKSEADTQRFAKLWNGQVPATSKGRILIPLWGCEAQWYDKALHLCEDERQLDYYYDCINENSEEQHLNLTVLSGEFEQYVFQLSARNSSICFGLQDWYDYWAEADRIREEQILLTKRYATIQPTSGSIRIRVISDSLSFIRENMPGAEMLDDEVCPKQAQDLLFDYALHDCTLDDAILAILNANKFVGKEVMSKWSIMGHGEKYLVVLWLKLHEKDDYLCHCVSKAKNVDDIPEHILHDVFGMYRTYPKWIAESQELVNAMGLERDEDYFKALDEIPAYEDRLQFLSGKDRNDRIYLLRLVGKWLRLDSDQVFASKELASMYPALFAYLDESAYDSDLSRYFSLYKAHKLENSLPEDEDLYFSGIQPEDYDFRYAQLSSELTDDCVILWVDALGAEWLPLLLSKLKQDKKGKIKKYEVVQATLPTETCFNDQWNQIDAPYKKLDLLDKLAHKGVIDEPDYYTCIEEQLSFVSGIQRKVDELLKEYHRVIITGDHGTSRLAARFFHKRSGASVHHGAKVCSHGRYCQIQPQTVLTQPDIVLVKDKAGNQYAVFNNYDHFIQSGFAAGADDDNAIYGEVHGGATPEEMLVPLIVFDSNQEIPLKAEWQSSMVKIMAKKAKATLKFNRPVNSLNVRIGAVLGTSSQTADSRVWTVEFRGVEPKTHNVTVAANGALVQVEMLTIKPALGGGEGDLP